MTFDGAIAVINTALNGMTFVPPANFSGAATLTVSSNDLGATGAGGPLSTPNTIIIKIGPASANSTAAAPDVFEPRRVNIRFILADLYKTCDFDWHWSADTEIGPIGRVTPVESDFEISRRFITR